MTGIIDYGVGNLKSVANACWFLGIKAEIIRDRKDIGKASRLILPGVGAFCDAARLLRQYEWDKEIKDAVANGKPLLGICLGMQLLFEKSYENGEHEGLGILPGEIVRIPPGEKVPHIGWNSLNIKQDAGLLQGLQQSPFVYFVHSYYVKTNDNLVSATTYYNGELTAFVEKGNVFAAQFHPEKSGTAGLQILRRFGALGES